MNHDTLHHLIALKFMDGLGDISIQKLVKHIGSPTEVLKAKASTISKIDGLGLRVVKALKNQTEALTFAEEELKRILKHKVNAVSWLDNNYPARLQQCIDKPSILFYKGYFETQPEKIISIVGTRKPSTYGKQFLEHFFKEIKPYNPIIVSGLAFGIDALAHKLALENQLVTYGIVAHGLYRIYPSEHVTLANNMVKQQGAILTESFYNAKPDRENFPKRNRIIAGLTDATIVVESDHKGGSLITAHLANDYNRDVMALPGSIFNKTSLGCNQLIKQNIAHMLTEPNDMIKLLNWDKQPVKQVQTQLFTDLTKEEQQIVDVLQHGSQLSVDQLSGHLQKPGSTISVQLLGLEMKGVVRALPGSYYCLNI